jgi:hypothetical protein
MKQITPNSSLRKCLNALAQRRLWQSNHTDGRLPRTASRTRSAILAMTDLKYSRPLSKLANVRRVIGDSARKTRVYPYIHLGLIG